MSSRQIRVITFIVLLAVCVFSGSHQAVAQTADQQSCEKGYGAITMGELIAVRPNFIAACTEAIKTDPKDAWAYFRLYQMFFSLDSAKAEFYRREAIKLADKLHSEKIIQGDLRYSEHYKKTTTDYERVRLYVGERKKNNLLQLPTFDVEALLKEIQEMRHNLIDVVRKCPTTNEMTRQCANEYGLYKNKLTKLTSNLPRKVQGKCYVSSFIEWTNTRAYILCDAKNTAISINVGGGACSEFSPFYSGGCLTERVFKNDLIEYSGLVNEISINELDENNTRNKLNGKIEIYNEYFTLQIKVSR